METTPISRLSWANILERTIARLHKAERPARVAIVGIGQELRGDDAAGIVVAQALRRLVQLHDRLLVIDAGPAPENYTGSLRRFAPDLVILIDAAQMDALPGAVRWLDWQSTAGLSASTHSLPCSVLASYLVADLGCEVALLGIQPADTTFGAPLAPAVRRSIDMLVQRLAATLGTLPSIYLW
jgi:hydrogenase 3 maturation protease